MTVTNKVTKKAREYNSFMRDILRTINTDLGENENLKELNVESKESGGMDGQKLEVTCVIADSVTGSETRTEMTFDRKPNSEDEESDEE